VALDRRLRRAHKLRKAREYSAVFAQRRRLASEHFQLGFRSNGLNSARLGIAVGKKQAHHAALRNLVKRLCRESFRGLRGDLPCYDIVLKLVAPLGRVDRAELRAELDSLLAKLRETPDRLVA